MEFYSELSDKQKKRVREILHKSDMVVALSEEWKAKFEKSFELENCVVLENGINMEALKPAVCDSTKHIKEFAVLGRLGKRKGTYDLIDAVELTVRTVPDIKCYLAGDGEIDKVKNSNE